MIERGCLRNGLEGRGRRRGPRGHFQVQQRRKRRWPSSSQPPWSSSGYQRYHRGSLSRGVLFPLLVALFPYYYGGALLFMTFLSPVCVSSISLHTASPIPAATIPYDIVLDVTPEDDCEKRGMDYQLGVTPAWVLDKARCPTCLEVRCLFFSADLSSSSLSSSSSPSSDSIDGESSTSANASTSASAIPTADRRYEGQGGGGDVRAVRLGSFDPGKRKATCPSPPIVSDRVVVIFGRDFLACQCANVGSGGEGGGSALSTSNSSSDSWSNATGIGNTDGGCVSKAMRGYIGIGNLSPALGGRDNHVRSQESTNNPYARQIILTFMVLCSGVAFLLLIGVYCKRSRRVQTLISRLLAYAGYGSAPRSRRRHNSQIVILPENLELWAHVLGVRAADLRPLSSLTITVADGGGENDVSMTVLESDDGENGGGAEIPPETFVTVIPPNPADHIGIGTKIDDIERNVLEAWQEEASSPSSPSSPSPFSPSSSPFSPSPSPFSPSSSSSSCTDMSDEFSAVVGEEIDSPSQRERQREERVVLTVE
ncbi:hypothetical protein CBR_g76079 [Chara braunii]|uniref:Uncharacterized protein n=1 Tax=Chara braunii TaxID=69332 RepID=A0A388JK10_CHABU|nr:hypothetical protein CBR_g76079 [Chara braunii]|eukprot:GBG42629.1 hypothetical protein CBR_g76079 [Chara braunii]